MKIETEILNSMVNVFGDDRAITVISVDAQCDQVNDIGPLDITIVHTKW